MADVDLSLHTIPVLPLTGATFEATAEGNNAAWHCVCSRLVIGRCYFAFGHTPHTVCPNCGARFRVEGDAEKRAMRVVQER